jgi:AraC-like DNA-binding protein
VAGHDDPGLDQAVIPPTVLAGLVDIGRREGLPVESWFSGTGLDPAQTVASATTRVSYRQAAAVLRRAVRAMPGRPLGMQVGTRDILVSFGLLGVAMRSCVTFGDGLALGLELHQAAGSLLDLEAETFGDEVALRLHERRPDPELVAFLAEELLCSTVNLARSVFGPGWSPSYIELGYPAPPYAEEYRRFFRCRVRFDADANRMIFPAAELRRPLPTYSESVRAAAVDACRRLLGRDGPRPDVVAAVEALLDRDLRHPLTMAEAAHRLHITERTLRRRLTAAGDRYSAIRDRVRERRATFLLRESTLPIGAVAREVGFNDAREFRRAYIRWTGRPPSAARRTADTVKAEPDG